MRAFWIGLGVALTLVVVLVLAGSIWIRDFLGSETFRALASARTSSALKVDGSYAPLRWTGSSVYSESFTATGSPSSPLESVAAQRVRANFNWRAILEGAWRVEEIDIGRLELMLVHPASTLEVPAAKAQPAALPGWLPSRFEIEHVNVADASLSWSVPPLQKGELTGSSVRALPSGRDWVLTVTGGKLGQSPLPPFLLDQADLRWGEHGIYLTKCRLTGENSGTVDLTGELADDKLQADASWKQVNIAEFLPVPWKDRLSGSLTGTAKVLADHTGQHASGRFILTEGMLTGLGMQEQIARFTGAQQFERMPIQEFSADYTAGSAGVSLSNVVLESRGLVRIEGTCAIDSESRIQGNFQIGVTPQSLQWLPGSREKVFTTSRNGYLWTSLRLSGTVDQPREDLSSRLAAAMGEETINRVQRVIENAPNLPVESAKTIQNALETLTPLIP